MAVHVCGAGFRCHTCNSFYVGYGGGPIWPYAFVVPDFGATRVTPSMWAIGGGPIWPYAFVVLDFGATCVAPSMWAMGGGPIWPYAFVVPDFGATCVAPSIVGCRGGLFGHVCLWCQILVPRVRPLSVVGCGGLPGHVCLVPDFGAMHAR